ncbi:hypothetical protein thalar_00301 [Litoreibacter arenae DSM 19593]|uniref:Uncharacterized protein n=1 Tax=Litoreibacter arenae DSM 19593 TaxID=1123360 RepID=S9S6A3_9RHOB|nr:hypothetical protein thalar_00301 [Litoreibacter arenae DSM 19593]
MAGLKAGSIWIYRKVRRSGRVNSWGGGLAVCNARGANRGLTAAKLGFWAVCEPSAKRRHCVGHGGGICRG